MLVIAPEPEELTDRMRAFRPPVLTARAAERSRRLAVPRSRVRIAPGWRASFLPSRDTEAWEEGGTPVEIDIRIDGETAHLRTVWPALETFMYQAEPRVQVDDLDVELAAALIETHAVETLEAFEELLGIKCAVLRIAKLREHEGLPHIDLNLSVNGSDEPYPAEIYASPSVLGMLATAWERRARTAANASEPKFLLAARVGTSTVSRAGLRGLTTGDALLFDRVAPDGGIVLCLGEQLSAVAQITETGEVTPGATFSAASPLLLGEFLMADDDFETEDGASALDDASIGNLPVRLVFELGRREMSLDELRELGVGAPIPLEKPATSVVDILANGRRVGAGEMVLIGDQLGVRITRLNGHA